MHRKLEKAVFALGIGGLLFAGYLSGVKFFSETRAFGESCPYFLGLPACYYGFAMYLIITIFAGLHVFHKYDGEKANRIVLVTAYLGILFAGYFTLTELPLLLSEGLSAYVLGLPTCALGLIFYIIIARLSLRIKRDFNQVKTKTL
jgi:uncharacterized membrane protein